MLNKFCYRIMLWRKMKNFLWNHFRISLLISNKKLIIYKINKQICLIFEAKFGDNLWHMKRNGDKPQGPHCCTVGAAIVSFQVNVPLIQRLVNFIWSNFNIWNFFCSSSYCGINFKLCGAFKEYFYCSSNYPGVEGKSVKSVFRGCPC